MKETAMKNYMGRTVAVDASMALYSFLIAVRSAGGEGGGAAGVADMLKDADGNVTSHLQGMFHRTIRLLQHGIRPVYVFDGKPVGLRLVRSGTEPRQPKIIMSYFQICFESFDAD